MTRLMRAMLGMTIVGAVMCFVPLFNLLGYEAAMLTGVAAGVLGMWCLHHDVEDRHPTNPEWSDAWMWFWRKGFKHQMLLLPPMALLLLNALRVTNCDITLGFLYWLLISLPAVWIGQVLMWALCIKVPYKSRRWMLAMVIVIINAIAMGLHIAFQPPITGHQWFIGFFSGSIYDEALSIPTSLLWYRLSNALGALAILVLIEAWRRRKAPVTPETLHPRAWIVLGLSLCVGWMVTTGVEAKFGVRVDRETIAETLGGRLETEHFVIHYPQNQRFSKRLALMAEDHEYRYAEMKALFQTDPVKRHGRKVHSFVYLNRDQKGDLMGARRTLIAKIWLREMHILWSGYGDHYLAHELAHIFTEPFGHGPLRLSARGGVLANMGLVEGVATAADNPPDDLSLHEASAAMRVLKIAPDIRRLVSAEGFWAQSSRRAYTLMGSFVLFLIDRYGIEPFKKAYGDADFQGAYNKSADALVTEWEAYIDGIKPRQEIMAIAKFRYTRPSIFGKVCARTIAELRRKASDAQAGGNMERAQALHREILRHQPNRISARVAYTRVLMEAKAYERATKELESMLKRAKLTPYQRAQLLHIRGDVRWLSKAFVDASNDYKSCLKIGVPSASQRLLNVKTRALSMPSADARALARRYLLERGRGATLYDVMRWSQTQPDDAVASYLAGRALFGARRWVEAVSYFERATTGLTVGVLKRENDLLLAQSLMHARQMKRARALFTSLSTSSDSRVRLLAVEWLARIGFLAKHNVTFTINSVPNVGARNSTMDKGR